MKKEYKIKYTDTTMFTGYFSNKIHTEEGIEIVEADNYKEAQSVFHKKSHRERVIQSIDLLN